MILMLLIFMGNRSQGLGGRNLPAIAPLRQSAGSKFLYRLPFNKKEIAHYSPGNRGAHNHDTTLRH